MSTKSRPSEFDALEKARDDEIMFPLLDRDPDAPATIHHWVYLRRQRAKSITDPEKMREELRQITEAEFIAFEMTARQKGQDSEEDAAPSKAPTYSGVVIEDKPIEKLMGKLRAELAEADYNLHEAIKIFEQAPRYRSRCHIGGSFRRGIGGGRTHPRDCAGAIAAPRRPAGRKEIASRG